MKTLRLAPSDDARCYVLDNKRPFHLANIYSRHKVAVFDDSDGDNDEDIPDDDGDLSLDSRSTDDDDLESHNEESLVDIDEDALDDASLSEVDDDVMEDGEIDDEIESVDDGDINDSHDEQLDIDATVNDNDESAELGGTDNPADPVINASFENNDLEVLGDDVEQNNLGRKRNANGDDLSDMGGDNDDGEEEEEKEEMLAPRKKQRIVNPVIVRRNELKRYYFQGNYVSVPTSVVVMKLVSSRVSASAPVDVMWQGAIGLCSQYEEGNISEDYYNEVCESVKMVLQDHLESSQTSSVYIQQVDGETDIAVPVAEAGNITEGLDYRFYLYRHWSLYESMLNSPYIMQKLSTWQSQGEIRLQEMLAKIGVSMEQAVQSYQFMTPTLRRHMSQQLGLESTKQEFGLQDPEVAFRSFFRHVSFRSAISTTDMVHAASALLDLCHFSLLSSPTTTDKMDDVVENLDNKGNRINNANAINDGQRVSVNEAFNEAYDCLGVKSEELLKKGIKAGIFIQKACPY